MKGKRNQHEWDFVGIDKDNNREYGFCHLCGKYRYSWGNGTFTFITKKSFEDQQNMGMVEK